MPSFPRGEDQVIELGMSTSEISYSNLLRPMYDPGVL